jgi:hypothetical protein
MLTSVRRGLLLLYGARVFGDTWRSVDEVSSPRFFVSITDSIEQTLLTIKTKTYENKNNLYVGSYAAD